MRQAAAIKDIRAAVAGGADPDDLVRERWEHARALQPEIFAFAHLPEEPPAAGEGPLAGVTVGVKDLIDTADMPTSYGSPIHAGHRPTADAAIVARLRSLGATALGKTVTTEFAWRQPGPTRNPWDLGRTPGGSSSGSAAAVAAGIVTLALGTQTLGSVIRPAAYCGVVGFKPSFGTFSRNGVHPLSGSLDHVGLFTRTAEDVMEAFSLLTDSAPATVPELGRLAVLRPPADLVSEDQAAAFDNCLRSLSEARWDIEEIEWPGLIEESMEIVDVIVAHEAAQILGDRRATRAEMLSRHIIELVDAGRSRPASIYQEALAAQRELRDTFASKIAGFDALLTVPAPGEAPEGLTSTGDGRFCAPWTVIGAPAVSLPVRLSAAGLPLGLQVIGRLGDDRGLLAIAAAISAIAPKIDAWPPVSTSPERA